MHQATGQVWRGEEELGAGDEAVDMAEENHNDDNDYSNDNDATDLLNTSRLTFSVMVRENVLLSVSRRS